MKQKIFLLVIVLLLGGNTIFPQSSGYSLGQTEGLYSELAQAYTLQGKDMTKEEEDKLLKNLSSEVKEKLAEIKKLNKNKYYSLLRQVGYQRSYLEPFNTSGFTSVAGYELESKANLEQHKKKVELEFNVEYLALKCKNSDGNDKQNFKKQLAETLTDLFEIRESEKLQEVKNLEKRLVELKESLQVRKQKKDEIVQRRVQELTGDSKYLKWD